MLPDHMLAKNQLTKINEHLWEIPQQVRPDMRVPARVFTSETMLDELTRDRSLEQLINVTTLQGIQLYALAMPDAHEGYGFPVGGVAAFDLESGIISPGGIGYDINCGVRLLKSDLTFTDVQNKLEQLARAIDKFVPSGVGRSGKLKLSLLELDQILKYGTQQMIKMNYGTEADLNQIESKGRLDRADPQLVSDQAKQRGQDQLGTMGAGNHFVEVDRVQTIYDPVAAQNLGLAQNQIVILIHTGSRGLGHQIATDYIRLMIRAMNKYQLKLPDQELACAPLNSTEGQQYLAAMSCAANFAWANRQMITWEVRKAWVKILGQAGGRLNLVYDVAHNIAKVENYQINGKTKSLLVHRKGATRAFPNQPVLIPGSMGTGSYVLIGNENSLATSFGSCCHGAGRRMSRTQARQQVRGDQLQKELKKQGIITQAGSFRGLAEEAPLAYKDVDQVVEVVHQAQLATKVARLKPLAVIKG